VRKVTFGVANSLDNFIARKNHGVDWLLWGKEAAAIMTKFWKTIDTVIMGRKTYDIGKKMSGKISYPGIKMYVISRTMKKNADKNVEVVSSNPVQLIRKLKKQKGKDICVMGGGVLAKSLLEVGVIDEVAFNIHPVLLGSGIPLFYPMKRQINLELRECKPFKNGCVSVTYRVKK
jgi:dihydrofolate reductase